MSNRPRRSRGDSGSTAKGQALAHHLSSSSLSNPFLFKSSDPSSPPPPTPMISAEQQAALENYGSSNGRKEVTSGRKAQAPAPPLPRSRSDSFSADGGRLAEQQYNINNLSNPAMSDWSSRDSPHEGENSDVEQRTSGRVDGDLDVQDSLEMPTKRNVHRATSLSDTSFKHTPEARRVTDPSSRPAAVQRLSSNSGTRQTRPGSPVSLTGSRHSNHNPPSPTSSRHSINTRNHPPKSPGTSHSSSRARDLASAQRVDSPRINQEYGPSQPDLRSITPSRSRGPLRQENEADRIVPHLAQDAISSFSKTNIWSHLLPHEDVKPASPTAMYWSRPPSHGKTPVRNFRAHSGCMVDSDLWIFGGTDQRGCIKDLYRMDADTFCWSRPKVKGDAPPAMRGHSAIAHDRRIFIIGGGDGPSYYQETYYFDTLSYTWTKPFISGEIPSPRRSHAAVLHEGRIIIFGGGNGASALRDVFALDISDVDNMKWTEIKTTGKKPVARGYHSMDLVKNKCIVFGGSDGSECFSDFHVLDLDTNVWTRLEIDMSTMGLTGRKPRLGHSSTVIGPYLFIFGGHDGTDYKNDVHTFNLVTLSWEPRPVYGVSPSLRGYHTAVFYDSRLIITGGFDGNRCFSDVHVLDLSSFAYLPQVTNFDFLVNPDFDE